MKLQEFLHQYLPAQHNERTRQALRRATPEMLQALSELQAQLHGVDFEFSINGIAMRFFENRFYPLEAATHARRFALEGDERLLEKWIARTTEQTVEPPQIGNRFALGPWIRALEQESVVFSLSLLDSPEGDTPLFVVALGKGAAAHTIFKPEFHAKLKWPDVQAVQQGKLRWTDLLLGRMQVEGDLSGFFRLSAKILEQAPR